MVVLLIIACVVIFSWKSVTSDEYGRTKIGRIEFDPEQLLGKERVQSQVYLRWPDTIRGIDKFRKIVILNLEKGCLGTKVYRGHFDGREVAVKRMLADSFALADREINMLRQEPFYKNSKQYLLIKTLRILE